MNPYVIMWLAIFALTLIVEAVTTALVCVWFMPSALICALIAALDVPPIWQYIIFFVLSIVLLLLFRKQLEKLIKSRKKEANTNLSAIIGAEGRVEEEINNFLAVGRVTVNSQSWSARSANGDIIPKDARVVIKKIEGVKLICEISEK